MATTSARAAAPKKKKSVVATTKKVATKKKSVTAAKKNNKTVKATGSRRQVWLGTAKHTSGGLTRADIKKNKFGKLVSIKASQAAKRNYKGSKAQEFFKVMNAYKDKDQSYKSAMQKASAIWHKVA